MPYTFSMKVALGIPDTHIPFEDTRAYSLMLTVALSLPQLDELILIGDYLDFYGVSSYDKDPSFGDIAELYDREIECGNARLDELDLLFPDARKKYLEGNHEIRLLNYMRKYAGALRNRITVPGELNLFDRPKWSWHPFTHNQAVQVLGSDLWARHRPFGGAMPKGQARAAGDSFMYGDTHQIGTGSFTTKMSGRVVQAINIGWLGDQSQRAFDYVNHKPDWRLGFIVIYVIGKKFTYDLVEIQDDYSCVFQGKRFSV